MQIEILQAGCIAIYTAASIAQGKKQIQASLAWLGCSLHIVNACLALGNIDYFSLNAAHAVNFSTAILVLGFLISSLRNDILILGLVLYPFAAISNLIAIISPIPPGEPISIAIMIHILLSVVAYSIIALGALEAVLIQILRYRLKNRKVNAIDSMMPPLQTLEKILFQTIGSGTLVLSTAILTGAYFVDHFFSPELIPKTTLTLMAWGLFSTLLIGRHWLNWGGQLAVRITLAGYGLLFLSFIGIKLLFG